MAFLFDIVVIVYGKGDDDMTWKELLKANITKAGELKERLHLTNEQETHLEAEPLIQAERQTTPFCRGYSININRLL